AELIDDVYKQFIPEYIAARYQASDILKRIILKPSKNPTQEQKIQEKDTEQLFAETGLRIGICRDIVGNTICADLLDYLHRDWYHLGKPKYFEKRLFQYMQIREDATGMPRFVISIGKKPRIKTDAVSAILDLLEHRYQLAESVLF